MPAVAAAAQDNSENAEGSENDSNIQSEDQTQQPQNNSNSENEPLLLSANDATQINEPQVSLLTVMKTFVVSFVASIIPEHPAM